jgi:hypothetical protein
MIPIAFGPQTKSLRADQVSCCGSSVRVVLDVSSAHLDPNPKQLSINRRILPQDID